MEIIFCDPDQFCVVFEEVELIDNSESDMCGMCMKRIGRSKLYDPVSNCGALSPNKKGWQII